MASEAPKKRILIVGDSFATGFAFDKKLNDVEGVTPFGKYLAGTKGHIVTIIGKEGANLRQVATATEDLAIEQGVTYDIAIVFAGANNALFNMDLAMVEANLSAISRNIGTLLAGGGSVHYCPVPPMHQTPYFQTRPDQRAAYTGGGTLALNATIEENVKLLNNALLAHAKKTEQAIFLEHLLCRMEEASGIPTMFAADGIHYSNAAQQILATALEQSIINPSPEYLALQQQRG